MERKIVDAKVRDDYDYVASLFDLDWVLDPIIYDGKPCRLENAVVYHMVKYTEEELAQLSVETEEAEPEITSIRSVPINDADELIQQGYVIKDTFAKNVTLVKYKEQEIEVKDDEV